MPFNMCEKTGNVIYKKKSIEYKKNKCFISPVDCEIIFNVLLNNNDYYIEQPEFFNDIISHKKQITDSYSFYKESMDFKSAWRLAVKDWLSSIEITVYEIHERGCDEEKV